MLLLVVVLVGITTGTVAYGADTPLLAFGLSGLLCAVAAGLPKLRPPRRPVLVLGAGGMLILALTQMGHSEAMVAAADIAILAGAAAVFFVGRAVCLETGSARRALGGTALVLLGLAVVSFVDHVTGGADLFGRDKSYHAGRLTGFFLSANTEATFLSMSAVFGTALVLRAVSVEDGRALVDRLSVGAVVPLLLVLFSVVDLFLTGSRGGTAMGLFGMVAMILWGTGRQHRRYSLIMVGILILSAIVLFFISRDVMVARIETYGAGNTGRDVLWPACWQAFLDAPLFGHGLGRFSQALASVTDAETAPALINQGAAHNFVLQWLVQTGIVGTLAGAMIVAAPILAIVRGLRRRRRLRAPLKASLVIFAVVFGHGLIDYALEIPAIVWWLSLFLGYGAGIADGRSSRTNRRGAIGRAR
ncbi:MAG: O-antigen ligase family protein [Parvularcula sp.]